MLFLTIAITTANITIIITIKSCFIVTVISLLKEDVGLLGVMVKNFSPCWY